MSCVLRVFWMVIAMLICAPVLAQSYPVKPIRLIVPFAPGGSTDLMGRLLGERIGTALGQQVIVDNRGGAGTRIGTELAARAPGDGYNLLITNIAFSINAGLHRNLAYDPRKDFSGVILLASQPTVLAAHPSLPVRSVQDVIRLARSRPGEVSFASSGIGGVGHIAGEMFKLATGVDLIHVPYKGGGPASIDLIAGQVMLAFFGMPQAMPHAKAGKMRFIAVADGRRPSALPDLPTIEESGVPGYRVENWIGVFAPGGTPREIIARLNAELTSALKLAELRQRLSTLGFELIGSTPEEFEAFVKADIDKYTEVIRKAGIRAN